MTAILRHQINDKKSALTLTFSPHGGHRHRDNLSIFYEDDGDIILGDHGYLGTSPVNGWMRSTFSHNLVIVDNQEQDFAERWPSLHRMTTSPRVSVLEASSRVYGQCGQYRRLVALFKQVDGATFVLDIFRVTGGRTHTYRIFSEIGSSDDEQGAMEFFGLDVLAAGRLAKGSAELTESQISGLKDPVTCGNPPPCWQALWKGSRRSYRLWFVNQVDEMIVSNGPGQEKKSEIGRRIRYLDAVRKGNGLDSTFIAVHEPLGTGSSGFIESVARLRPAGNAGKQAVALNIRSKWGDYLILIDFAEETELRGVKFKGKLGIRGSIPDGKTWMFASEAETFGYGSLGFSGRPARWAGSVENYSKERITVACGKPANWVDTPSDCQNYGSLGFSVAAQNQ